MLGSELSRSGRQHGEEVGIVGDDAAASQLGRVSNYLADAGADERPGAEAVEPHQLADPGRERYVGVERAVGVPRRVVGGRRAGGPN